MGSKVVKEKKSGLTITSMSVTLSKDSNVIKKVLSPPVLGTRMKEATNMIKDGGMVKAFKWYVWATCIIPIRIMVSQIESCKNAVGQMEEKKDRESKYNPTAQSRKDTSLMMNLSSLTARTLYKSSKLLTQTI